MWPAIALYAKGLAHVESYGADPVVVYAPDGATHGNFYQPAYAEIAARPEWMRRFDKIHAQARSLPKADRRWRELDSCASSDALLMNIFCTPGVLESQQVAHLLGIDEAAAPEFGWRARVPLANGRFDRTEVDMRVGRCSSKPNSPNPTSSPAALKSSKHIGTSTLSSTATFSRA